MDDELARLLEQDIDRNQRKLQEVLDRMAQEATSPELIEEGLCSAHTLKALSAVKGVPHLEHFSAQLEQLFLTARKLRADEVTQILLPDIQKLRDDFSKTSLMVELDKTGRPARRSRNLEQAIEKLHALDRQKSELALRERQKRVNHNLVSVEALFQSYVPWIRQVAKATNKSIEIDIQVSEPLFVHHHVISALQTLMVHLLRNAVYHGIEPPSERQRSGKRPDATLQLSAEVTPEMLVVSVSDDGIGIDSHSGEGKETAESYSSDCWRRENTTVETSIYTTSAKTGLGVGLFIVREQTKRLDGQFELRSIPGVGTSAMIHIPKSRLQLSSIREDNG